MNGSESQNLELEQFLTPKQQKMQQKNRDNLRLILTVLTTNIFVALMVSNFHHDAPVVKEELPVILENHLLMHLPLHNLVPIDEGPQKVSLFDQEGKLVIYGATLNRALSDENSFDREGLYALQIPTDQVQELINYQKETLTAHPFLLSQQQQPIRRSYEIVF